MKPIIQWVMPYISNDGYWACRYRKGFSYKSGVGRTPHEAYRMWAQINGVGYAQH